MFLTIRVSIPVFALTGMSPSDIIAVVPNLDALNEAVVPPDPASQLIVLIDALVFLTTKTH